MINYKLEEQVMNTINLLAKRKGQYNIKDVKVYDRDGNLCQKEPSFIGGGGKPNMYINLAELPPRLLAKIEFAPMVHYAGGKILQYIGNYDYPINGVMKPKELNLNHIRYFYRINRVK